MKKLHGLIKMATSFTQIVGLKVELNVIFADADPVIVAGSVII